MTVNKNDIKYVDQEGYDKLVQEIENLKQLLIKLGKSKAGLPNVGIGSNSYTSAERDDITNEQMRIMREIIEKEFKLYNKVKLVQNVTDDSKVAIGDIVKLTVDNGINIVETGNYKLITVFPNELDSNYEYITLNSPFGQAIYGKNIGATSTFLTPEGVKNVYIEEKVMTLQDKVKVKSKC